MFWSKKKKEIIEIPKEEKKKELLKREIFSASDAKLMHAEARTNIRNKNRMEIFRQVKAAITNGYHKYNLGEYLFADGNDIYFEGLGYKVKPVWIENYTGVEHFEEPLPPPTTSPDGISQSGNTIITGTGLVGNINSSGMWSAPYRNAYQKYIQISWE